ncbi:MAG: hypothetical protein MJ079_02200 [Ruminococcus sp.]|nr:hypothetical protein [Ruminococcus sp.]
MNWINNERFIRYSEGKAVIVANIGMDTTADLPEADAFEGRILDKGSVAHDVDTGDYYCLNSLGVWKKQQIAGGGSFGTLYNAMPAASTRALPIVGDLEIIEEV